MKYLVESTTDWDEETITPLFWSNEDGWVDRASATIFPTKEGLNLPIGGKWVEVTPDDDAVTTTSSSTPYIKFVVQHLTDDNELHTVEYYLSQSRKDAWTHFQQVRNNPNLKWAEITGIHNENGTTRLGYSCPKKQSVKF